MESNLLLHLAVIIILAKLLSALSRKFKQPPVIGLLLLGVLLGPTALNLIKPSEVIVWLGKIGVLFLLFEAGMETDLKKIRSDSRQAFLPALGGVLLPFALGFMLSYFFSGNLLHSLVVGIIFTATSVSVSVMTLLDLGKFRGVEGRCIVNAAIIDDIIGILLLTFIFGLTANMGSGSVNFIVPLLKIVAFFILALVVGYFLLNPFFLNLQRLLLDNVVLALVIAVIFLYSWFAELTGLAAITGAYFAGIFIGQTEYKTSIQNGITLLGKSLFVDIFFVGLGLEFNLLEIEAEPLYLGLFIILAIVGKIIGCGTGARLIKFDYIRSLRIGVGMIPRGEVALIVANMALQKDMITHDIISATILMVICTAIVTPVLLKYGFTRVIRKSFEKEL
ncbi:MAG: cation:proton antiporter [Candidatus Cloacimonetes bacterium]|nr:cation:proton antiporter [Candidatus Cloacimonadota bacterium]